MKSIRLLLTAYAFFSFHPLFAATRYWDGGGDGQSWADPVNWDLDMVPDLSDEVVLDHRFVPGAYLVRFPAGNTGVEISRLFISPGGGDSIRVLLPPENTSLNGFLASGAGDALVIDDRGVFTNASGAASGTPVSVTTNGIFRINNGGTYLHQTARGHTNFLVSRLSTAAGTENGIFCFDVPGSPNSGYTVSLSGRQFGTLVFSGKAAGGAKKYAASGSNTVTVRGSLVLEHGAQYSHNINANITTGGDCRVDGNSRLDISTAGFSNRFYLAGSLELKGVLLASGTAYTELVVAGTVQQSFTGAGKLEGDSLFVVLNNEAGLLLGSHLVICGGLIFKKGHIYGNDSNCLVLPSRAVCSGASDTSHVNGPVIRAGANALVFPVGEGGLYAPLILGNDSSQSISVADSFRVSYYRQNPQAIFGPGMESTGLDHISQVEYWAVESLSGNASRKVTLFAGELSFATDGDQLKVARLSMVNHWVDAGRTALAVQTPVPFTGFVSSQTQSQFGIFTLGSEGALPINPLPLEFVGIRASEIREGVRLDWELGGTLLTENWFSIQRSEDGLRFTELRYIRSENQRNYFYIDSAPVRGRSWYRVVLRRPGLSSVESKTVLVDYSLTDPDITLQPNVVEGDLACLHISGTAVRNLCYTITSINGLNRGGGKLTIPEQERKVNIDTRLLPGGYYVLTVWADGIQKYSLPFFKR